MFKLYTSAITTANKQGQCLFGSAFPEMWLLLILRAATNQGQHLIMEIHKL